VTAGARSKTGHRPRASGLGLIAIAIAGCKGGTKPKPPLVIDAAPRVVVDAAPSWPELDGLPHVSPTLTIELPTKAFEPLVSLAGPVASGDLAVLGSSQFGFAAIDWRTGKVAWRRETGPHVAPPVVHADGVLVVGECPTAGPRPKTKDVVVGCWWIVASHGLDLAAGRIAGTEREMRDFVAARGEATLIPLDDHRLTWTRGDAAIAIDLDTGRATPASVEPVAAIARYKGREWRIAIEPDDALVARDPSGAEKWRMVTRFAAVIGVLPGESYEVPMVRVVNLKGASGRGFVDLIDIDATGSKLGQAGALVPGLEVIGHAFAGAPGHTALALRLDNSIERDYIAAHDGRGNLAWVWPLPRRPRADRVGLAFTETGEVLAFHDGDRLTILPPVTVSKNATP
jgi:hypothetical protein